MEHLSNDHEDHPNQHENSHKLCDEMEHPVLNLATRFVYYIFTVHIFKPYFMASLDVESLFTNIPLEETIKICCDSLYKNQELLRNISKNQFEKLLRAALSNNYFLFDLSTN